jgi:hypothetical protein
MEVQEKQVQKKRVQKKQARKVRLVMAKQLAKMLCVMQMMENRQNLITQLRRPQRLLQGVVAMRRTQKA